MQYTDAQTLFLEYEPHASTTIALYLHWPFCLAKCPYCDFNSHVENSISQEEWALAYLRNVESFAPLLRGRTLASVFMGGGTPSLMDPDTVRRVLQKLRDLGMQWDETTLEVTLEANPTSAEAKKFANCAKAGVNRLSLGIQSLRPAALQFLGREHDVTQARQAIAWARDHFPRYSFDLIYARPNQTLAEWQEELEEAMTLAGEHLSLYQLTIEKGTPFYAAYQKGAFTMPDEDLAYEFYQYTQEYMTAKGLPAYEVSNHAKPGAESRHNLVYWRYQDYLGIGPGAHSRVTIGDKHYALMMWHKPEQWLASTTTPEAGLQQCQALLPYERMEEYVLMGMRLKEGMELQRLSEFLHQPRLRLENTKHIQHLQALGFLESKDGYLKATLKGFPVLSSIIEKITLDYRPFCE